MTLMRGMLRLVPAKLRVFHSEAAFNAAITKPSPDPAPIPKRLRAQYAVTEDRVRGHRVVTVQPRGGGSGTHVMLLHGGGYLLPVQAGHWGLAEQMVRRTGATVVVPMYPRIAQEGAIEAHEFVQEVYREVVLRAGANAVFILGDSAGGGLALACAVLVRDRAAQLRQADGVILVSPWVDVTMSNPQIVEFERRDALLSGAGLRAAGNMWAGALDLHDPRISPLYADLAGLPPVHVFQGDHDVLAPDAALLVERLRAVGGTATIHLCRGGFHDYIMAPFTPEARQTLDRMWGIIGDGAL